MRFLIEPFNQKRTTELRNSGRDDNDQIAEKQISDGGGNPCRSCLKHIPAGEMMLVVGMRPFERLNPYAECGPVFFCEKSCTPWGAQGIPPVLQSTGNYLVKAYSADERIIYGTGQITPTDDLTGYIDQLFKRADVAFVDIRSSRNNCFLARARR
ncbi:DUF1203 domain-containing protein [Halocynthiibacter styelae]|uniref:DUF1203 domain-containing protein n=1 Tax=Halocynthiibacter styelae TaxID=2761955 RepID=A0A8J7LKX9_9RHOB|nr:DUF1203 domain-containing protein [Paenihalocynthiibacter styelae]MBI1494870.1 DUF1203 domain-containing protein [Paenihalocynthiibacter styelae]